MQLFRATKMVEVTAGPTTFWSLRRNKAVKSAAASLAACLGGLFLLFPQNSLRDFCGSPSRESAFGFGPKVRTSKLGCTAKNRRPAKADLRFLVEATGFSPLAARPGEQPTGLFSLRRTISVFGHFVRKPLALRSRLHPQIPSMFAIHKKELT